MPERDTSLFETPQDTQPVVVFRSSDPIEAGRIANALAEAGVKSWVHDDVALQLPWGLETLELSLGRPSCVSVPATAREQALRIISGLRPRAFPAQSRSGVEPIHGFGFQAPARGRLLAWVVLAGLLLIGLASVLQVLRGRPF